MGNKTVYEEDTNEENEKKNCFFVSVILAGNIFTASMGNLQVNAAEATVGAESREMAEASVVIGLEIRGHLLITESF